MRQLPFFVLSLFVAIAPVATLMGQPVESYPVHPDSEVQAGVPQGKIVGPLSWKSQIFPGTERDYWIYVPAQYDPQKPACVMIVQDGLNRANEWKLPAVMDNLIHQQAMPVTIGIFVNPGVVPAPHEQAQPRFNRSFEYDGLGDTYARFLLEELLPEVEKTYSLSHDPNDRALAGASSGAICAFTAAWERPDAFRRVVSTIGTYVGLRGGDIYPTLIRKTEPKPLRIFLQDGSHDLNIYGGDWWTANLDMLSALKYAGYDVHHAWGEGGHSGKHGAAVMPDVLRWLWRDYPTPIRSLEGEKPRMDLLIPGESWEEVSSGHAFTEGPAVDPQQGDVLFTDIPRQQIFRIDLHSVSAAPEPEDRSLFGKVTVFTDASQRAAGLMYGSDGYLYATSPNQILRFAPNGKSETVIADAPGNDLVTLPGGGYYTDPAHHQIWYVNAQGERRVVDEGMASPNGLICSPDQTLLHVADTSGRFTYSFQIQPDGSLRHKQRYGYLHVPDEGGSSGADGMTMDTEGRLYVATKLGLQVLDQLGRVNFIFANPHSASMTNVVLGGPSRDILVVTMGNKVFRRKIRATGIPSCESPVLPPKPHL